MLKKIILKILRKLGYTLYKNDFIPLPKENPNTMLPGLKRSKKNIPPIGTIVDVGAAAGTWYENSVKVWPDAQYVLFEPLIERKKELEILRSTNQNITLCFSALGKEKSKLQFTISDDLDGSGFYGKGNLRDVDVEALDDVLKELKKPGPYVLKLDTHGFEMPIFEGAKQTLRNTELIIVEVYGFYVAPDSLLFWQICEYLDTQGFRLFDMVDTMRRNKDQAFWQTDAFFMKKSNPIFADNLYA